MSINIINKVKIALILIFMSMLVLSLSVFGQDVQSSEDILIPSEKVRGVVLMQDGETPVDNLRIRVWDATTEEIVYRTETNADGLYTIPKYETGNYYVTIGPVKIDMRVLQSRGATPQHSGFVLILPKKMPLPMGVLPVTTAVSAVPLVVSS